MSLLEAVRKTCRCLGVKTIETSNGAAEVTVKLLRRQANLLIQQLERFCGIPEGTIGCQHSLYSWALLHAARLHNRYVVKQGHTAYELCAVAMFGECVLGCLRQSAKGAPQWTKGIWLGKTINNDVNIVAVPGNNQLFVTRSIRRFPNAWNGEMSEVETCPWQFSYASLGSQLILAKRIAPPTPAPFVSAPLRDEDAEAVRNVPPTPDEAPHRPRVLPAPVSGVPALEGDALDETMGQAAGVPSKCS